MSVQTVLTVQSTKCQKYHKSVQQYLQYKALNGKNIMSVQTVLTVHKALNVKNIISQYKQYLQYKALNVKNIISQYKQYLQYKALNVKNIISRTNSTYSTKH